MALYMFEATPNSGAFSVDPPTYNLEYKAAGEANGHLVWAYAVGATPAYVLTTGGLVYRQDIQVDPDGHKQFIVRVPYGQRKKETGSYSVRFDTSGATAKIKVAREHIDDFPASGETATDHKGTIGVKDGEAEGADIVIPALKLDISFKHPQGVITIPQIKALSRATGTVNSVAFLDSEFAAGELLFLGVSGVEGTDVETELNYSFAASENVTDLTMGEIASIVKKGHHYAWVEFKKEADSGKPAVRPRCVYVERVYNELPWPSIFGWGG